MDNKSIVSASIKSRIIAFAIDLILLSTFYALASDYLYESQMDTIYKLSIILYFSLMESSFLKATFGKFLLGIQVVTINGNRINFLTALLRLFMKSLTWWLSLYIILLRKKDEMVHDKIMKTIVIQKT